MTPVFVKFPRVLGRFPRFVNCSPRQNDARWFSGSTVSDLKERGLLQTIFPENKSTDLTRLMMGSAQCIYAGFDPTADSLHTGNLLVIMALIHCQRSGHSPIALLGGATGMIGDPSGKQTDRTQMDLNTVSSNLASINQCLNTIFTNHQTLLWRGDKELPQVRIENNADWYKGTNVVDWFSAVGRHFRIGHMMQRHSVRSRMESEEGLNFSEFSYQIFQAYDWLHLYRKYKCRVQIGGNDQTGNMAAGYELVKKVTNQSVYGLTVPLLTGSGGEKLGKSEGNVVWLDAARTTPFQLYQHYVNCPDVDVEQQLKLFTFLPNNELSTLIAQHKAEPDKRKAQKKLAEQVVLLVHGEYGLEIAKRCTNILFRGNTADLFQLSADELTSLFREWPRTRMRLDADTSLLDMVTEAKCFDWEPDADRIIKSGGVYVNFQRCTNPDTVLVQGQHILNTGYTLIRIGKKKFHLIEWLPS